MTVLELPLVCERHYTYSSNTYKTHISIIPVGVCDFIDIDKHYKTRFMTT